MKYIELTTETLEGSVKSLATIGDRVQLSPALDLWMQGATHGTIRDIVGHVAVVKMDCKQVRKLQYIANHYLIACK